MTPFSLPAFIKYLIGIFLLQGATALLLMMAQDADLHRTGWLIGLLGILIGVIAALWFSTITSHASQHSLIRASEKYNRQRDRIRRQAEKEKTREIRNSHQQVLRETRRLQKQFDAEAGRSDDGNRRPGRDAAVYPVHDTRPAGRVCHRRRPARLRYPVASVPGDRPFT